MMSLTAADHVTADAITGEHPCDHVSRYFQPLTGRG